MCKYREKLICLLARFFFHSTEWDLHNVWWASSFSFPYIFLLLGSTESTVVIWLSVFDCENQAARRARTEMVTVVDSSLFALFLYYEMVFI